VCLVYVIHLSKRVENNEEKARLSASFFTFFREKKVELLLFFKNDCTVGRPRLSLWRSLSRRILSNALSWCTV
jgi:hypothetical protein